MSDQICPYRGRDAVLVANLLADHKPDCFLVSKRNSVAFPREIERGVANELEPYILSVKAMYAWKGLLTGQAFHKLETFVFRDPLDHL